MKISLPIDWRCVQNSLPTVEPSELTVDSPEWEMFFDEDLLQIQNPTGDLIVDIGWYPSGDPSGHFALKIIQNQDWQHPVKEYTTRSLALIKVELNRCLAEFTKRAL